MTKKQLELHLIDEFRRLSPEFSLTRIEQPKSPAPDILADFRGSRIGIEITGHLYQPGKQRESEEELIIKMARRQYQATGKPAVCVSVDWVTHQQRRRSDRTPLSQTLVSVVAQNVPKPGTWLDLDWSSLPEPLASTVHHVRIDRLIDYMESDWKLPRAGWFPTLRPDDIRTTIAKKESRFDGYRQYCDAVWLLLASEGFGPSSWCKVSDETRQETYSTRFSHFFVLATHPKEVIKLSVRPRDLRSRRWEEESPPPPG